MSSSAGRPEGAGGRQYHIGLAKGEVAERILLVGDPARARKVADHFDTVSHMRTEREYLTFTGVHEGLELSVMATGMGADNTEIALVELLNLVAKPTLLRIGTCGGIAEDLKLGDLVVSTGALRLESTTLGWVDEGYPAVAHPEAVLALAKAASEAGCGWQQGITATAAGFYGWQGRSAHGVRPRDEELVARLSRQGVLNLEMEVSALLTLASLFGARAGAMCTVLAERHADRFITPEEKEAAEDRAIAAGLRALHHLDRLDRAGGAAALFEGLAP